MTAHIQVIRDRIRSAPNTVCLERARLVTEAYKLFEGAPPPLLRAKSFAHILEHMSLDLDTNPVFAGNTSTAPGAWMLLPEYGFVVPGQAVVENPVFNGFLDGKAVPDDIREFWKGRSAGGAAGIGHLAVDNQLILKKGLAHAIERARSADTGSNSPEDIYRQACVISCEAVIRWAKRYADAAERRTSESYRRIADACRQVPALPARDLFEGMQSLILVHLAIHIEGHGYSVSPGRLDQDLIHLFNDDSDAVALGAALLLKLNANTMFGSHSKTQAVTLGGTDREGGDASNAMTDILLDACSLAHIPDPTVFLRWHRNLPRRVKRKAITMLTSGLSFPLLVGDDETTAGLASAGIEEEDAADYCVIGCNELGIPGKLIWESITLPEASLLRDVLISEDQPLPPDTESLLNRMSAQAKEVLATQVKRHISQRESAANNTPTPFTSALMQGCIEEGKDLRAYMPYMNLNIRSSGFANLVNGLSAIESLIFCQRRASFADFIDALKNGYTAREELRQLISTTPKWGNDEEEVDGLAKRWCQKRNDVIEDLQAQFDMPLLMEMVVRSLHHTEGGSLGATPDGREAGAPLADSIGAITGTASHGPTATLKSVCKLDPSTYWKGGYNLNITLPLTSWASEEMRDKLESLVTTFFDSGGQELQINCLDPDTLRSATENPEQHRDLMVRIAGFNAFFVRLSPTEQREILFRAECA